MILGGVDFGNVWTASGVRNYGAGYWYHQYLRPFGLNFRGSTCVMKTICTNEVKGNLPLDANLNPTELKPRCIYVDMWRKLAHNAVALSGPGIKRLLELGILQRWERPFVVSYMAVAETPGERLRETQEFVEIINSYGTDFAAPWALEDNESCPNTAAGNQAKLGEIRERIAILSTIRARVNGSVWRPPVGVKLNPLFSTELAAEVAELVAFLGAYNTIPFAQIPLPIKRSCYGGEEAESPMKRHKFEEQGGGSGAPFLEMSLTWNFRIRAIGVTRPLIGGLGIYDVSSATRMWKTVHASVRASPSVVAIGSMSMHSPWHVQSTIRAINLMA